MGPSRLISTVGWCLPPFWPSRSALTVGWTVGWRASAPFWRGQGAASGADRTVERAAGDVSAAVPAAEAADRGL
eukprot:2773413-Prymnesium_polylepis.1